MLTAISPRQLYYELEADRLAVIQVSLPETQRQIGITQRTDSDPSPAARLIITVNPGDVRERLVTSTAGARLSAREFTRGGPAAPAFRA